MPFDPTRVFDRCVMCGGLPPYLPSGMSREHLFGDSLAKMMATVQKPIPWRADIATTSGFKTLTGGQPVLSAVSVCLCRCCNVGFSEMMGAAQPLIFALATGTIQLLDTIQKRVLLRYFERLGYIVDVLGSDFEMTEAFKHSRHNKSGHWRQWPPVRSPADRLAWLRGERSGLEPRVFIGRHIGVLGLNPETSANAYGDGTGNAVQRRFHTAIGQLAIELQIGEEIELYKPADSFVQITYEPGHLPWPPARNVSYGDFYALYEREGAVQQNLHFLSHPLRRMAWEAHVRRQTAV